MRRTVALLCCLALLFVCGAPPVPRARAQEKKQTPAPEDTPQPVAGDIGLAGAPCPDIARYLNVRSASAPSLSPDGSLLAFRISTTGTPQVWVAETREAAAPQQITFGESVTFHDWSPDGRWIAYGVDRGGNEREGFYLISPDGTREQELLAPSDAFRRWGAWSRDGRHIAYAATEPGGNDFSIYTINLNAEIIRPLRVYAGRGGLYVAGWRPDATGLLLTKTRGEDANDVLYLNLRTGEAETLFEPREAARYASFSWTPDTRGFYLATNEERDFAGLAFYDISARKLRWIETPAHDVEFVRLSADGRFLAWTENVNGFSELHLRDLQTNRTVVVNPPPPTIRADSFSNGGGRPEANRPASALPRGIINALEWATEAPRLAIELSSPQVPGDIWVLDASRGIQSITFSGGTSSGTNESTKSGRKGRGRRDQIAGQFLSASALTRVTRSTTAGLDPQRFVTPEPVSFPSHDGLTIYGLLYMPSGASDKRRPPVILSVHGGPTSQARPDFSPVQQYLLARGYAVLDLNFRGSTGFGKRFTRLDNGRLRPNAVQDMAAAVDWLARSGRPVNASRVAVMGGSYGGYMTYAALAQLPDKFAAGVSFVGVSDWVTALEGASPELKASDRIEYGNIDDLADREFFRQLSPLTHVANVRAPLLVSHGANDPRDPVTEADQIVRAIRERGGDVEYLRFPDEGHGIRKLSNRITAYRRVARFLERTLGGGTVECDK